MTTPPPPPPAPGGAGNTITVNKDNVLAARKAVLEAVEEAEEKLRRLRNKLIIDPPAKDDISVAAATAWNRNLLTNEESHYNRLLGYVDKIRELGEQLGEAARQYGFTEEQIEASFKTVDRHQD
jgi:hypothetical protein